MTYAVLSYELHGSCVNLIRVIRSCLFDYRSAENRLALSCLKPFFVKRSTGITTHIETILVKVFHIKILITVEVLVKVE